MRLFTILMTLLIAPMAYGWPERGPDGVPTGREIDSSAVFSPGSWRGITVVRTDPAALAAVARSTAAWMRAHPDDPAVVAGLLGETGVSLQDVLVTLDLVARLADEDIANGTTRLTEPEFLAQHFSRVSWKPDAAGARARGVRVDHRIRMTRYLVYRQTGSLTPTAAHPYALYAAPPESAGDADPVRLRYTRQDVIGGVFESKGAAEGLAEPLVWLTEQGVYRALMQGTVDVLLPDGSHRMFNVHRHNGIPYDAAVKNSRLQRRYWYFQPVDGLRGYGGDGADSVILQPGVTVAGDIYNLGLGKLMGLEFDDGLHLVVLADTGGAFQPNLHQLDYLTGMFEDHAAFQKATSHLPARTAASVLVARPNPSPVEP